MSIPDVSLSIKDGALGIVPAASDTARVMIGVCSLGTVNQIVPLTDVPSLIAALGIGPLVEAAAYSLNVAGGPIFAVRVNASVAGTIGSITKSNAGGPTITAAPHSGGVLDSFNVVLVITRTGALGVGAFKYTLDGGDTFSAEITIPGGGSYNIVEAGIDLTFPSGTYTANDTYTFSTVAPSYALGDLQAAIDAVLADPREWGFLQVVGACSATVAAGVDVRMATAANNFRFAFAVLEARGINVAGAETEGAWITSIQTDYAAFASSRVMVVAGEVEQISQVSGKIYRRPAAWEVAARIAKVPISEDLGRVASGPIPGITLLYHDEQAVPSLDATRFTTLRTIIGRSGFFITNGQMMASAGSDFGLVQRRRVMDRACKIARNALLTFLGEKVLVNADGTIAEKAAQAIEKAANNALRSDLVAGGHASATAVTVNRSTNVLSTQRLDVEVRVTAVGYAKSIATNIGFSNPSLAVA